ncbi:proline-rich protein HaeIII subfamily 1-like [Oenanthe melanoleuca]|uniref:proline-rich protein HaeIII subfamily 1-like n=1 Tax=Oenanthe melanoleuca TaxID=2939378 RepID=UPI0024C0FA77|nr:proline-rich protein HaeIII subfamily 1-like [Oenanthe melanoleuca]XP_056371623.1 proline-rich protein HaeIII subfamily 1-like [Oenanthe melanoleuca]XP_056371624.1 proline-rich protein HaeIII subfamily 1-like [Oenanthe melanoleuca]XP_056371627.1 proline-rich protein HaeIII subfamily 1-like [Oenanthe melanoleuca]XP_056371747.1 proline-rich protein HaeIII subfamily 1-like [Oenanthe melanoleuca]XP_056371748.1 proline-rich protein HaeIII subfamily 1-like [Oenanthe melanoleuca]
MAPPGCLPRCHLRGSFHGRGRARRPLPPPRQSFSGPGVSLSSPALRPRGPPRLGPPRRRGGRGPANRNLAHAPPRGRGDDGSGDRGRRPAAPPGGGSHTRAARPERRDPERPRRARPVELLCRARGPLGRERDTFLPGGRQKSSPLPRCGTGRRSRLLRAPKAFPPALRAASIRLFAIGRRMGHGRAAGRRPAGEEARAGGRVRLREGPCRGPLPPDTRTAL